MQAKNPARKKMISDYNGAGSLDQMIAQHAELLAENIKLKKKVEELSSFGTSRFSENVNKNIRKLMEKIDVDTNDPAPSDQGKRAEYMSRVAGFYENIFKEKAKHMISNCYRELEAQSNTPEYDQAIKGSIYLLREILRWGEACKNEQISNQIDGDED